MVHVPIPGLWLNRVNGGLPSQTGDGSGGLLDRTGQSRSGRCIAVGSVQIQTAKHGNHIGGARVAQLDALDMLGVCDVVAISNESGSHLVGGQSRRAEGLGGDVHALNRLVSDVREHFYNGITPFVRQL